MLLEMVTYRYRGHSMSDPAKYRAKEEVDSVRDQHDPIESLRKILLADRLASEDELKAMEKEIRETVNAAAEFAQFSMQMPKGWNEGTVTALFVWSHAATATNFGVVWGIQGLAVSDDDALDAAFGTAQTVTDTGGTTSDLYRSPETAAVTIGGTPAEVEKTTEDGKEIEIWTLRQKGMEIGFFTYNPGDQGRPAGKLRFEDGKLISNSSKSNKLDLDEK